MFFLNQAKTITRRWQQRFFVFPIKSTHLSKELKMRIWESEPLYGRNQAITWKTTQDLAKKTCGILVVVFTKFVWFQVIFMKTSKKTFNSLSIQKINAFSELKCKVGMLHPKYTFWMELDASAVTGWYCKCKPGARVVGVCAHIASTHWYLGYARHNPDISFGVRN